VHGPDPPAPIDVPTIGALINNLVRRERTETYAMPKSVLIAREAVRSSVALGVLAIYVFMFVKALGFAHTLQEFEILMGIFLPLLTALIGGAVGYLFGGQSQR
jgi:hypothetical protein